MTRVLLVVLFTVALVEPPVPRTLAADDGWLQWGGPRRNFTALSAPLATEWPAGGPPRLWDRSLGEGHSTILVEGGRLYTMYRQAGLLSMVRRTQSETIGAFDAATGKTIWEHTYPSSTSGLALENGAGPHATPLIVGNTLFAIGSRTELFALDKSSGKVIWQHNLVNEFGAPQEGRGFAPSPIAYRDTVIVPTGAKGGAVMAFNQRTGALAWKNGDYPVGPASPVLINVDGQDQLVVSGGDEILGVDPSNGSVLWRHPHKTDWGLNISTPVWGDGNLLFVSAAYNNGARLLRVTQTAGKSTVQQQWYQNRMKTHIGTVIRLGDFYVGSNGDFGPCPTVAVDVQSGRILWQNREFARSTFLHADGKLIVLDEDGNLGLAAPTRQGLNVMARGSVLSNKAWTVPTLVGTRLFVRDRARMMAFELGRR
jgi:outer membrane protein assembly factor BamB